MINSLRNFAKTKFAGLLVFIMIIPFVFWGMGGMFSTGNTNTVAKINKTNIAIIIKVDIAPVLPNSKVVTKALGISATIPAKIINDIPFPIPLWVICSPSHIKKIVPATMVVTVEILKKAPGLITKSAEDSKPTAKP